MPRKKANIHYLYKTTCLITGRYYIGMHSTANLEDGYMGSGKQLRYSIRKYGKENHVKEILEFFDSRELLVEAEKQAITSDTLIDKMCMNLKEGGTGGNQGLNGKRIGGDNFKYVNFVYWKNEENKKRLSEIVSTKNIEQWKNEDYRKKILDNLSFKGKKHSDETKMIMSEKAKQRIGVKNSQYGTMWITNGVENKKIKKQDFIPNGWYKGRI